MFRISIKDKRTKLKESIPLSLLLSMSKHKFLEIVMFMTYKDDLDLFLNGPCLWNWIINPMLLIMAFCFKSLAKRYIFQLRKCEHKGVSKSIDSDDRNFSSVKPQQFAGFFLNHNILCSECLYFRHFDVIWIYNKNQN